MNIACPSYNRYDTIGNKTLLFLSKMNGVKREDITIFVADQEQHDLYAEHNPGYNIVIGEKGVVNIRNFIMQYYEKKLKKSMFWQSWVCLGMFRHTYEEGDIIYVFPNWYYIIIQKLITNIRFS